MCLSGVSHVCLSSSAAIRSSVHTCSAGRAEHKQQPDLKFVLLAIWPRASGPRGNRGGGASVPRRRARPRESIRRAFPQATREGVPPKLAWRGWLHAPDGRASSFGLFYCREAGRAADRRILQMRCSAWLGRQHGFGFTRVLRGSLGGATDVFGQQEVCPDRDSRRQEAHLACSGKYDEQGLRRCCIVVVPHRDRKKLGKKDALKQQVRDFACLADTSSRMYAGAMAGLELRALAANPKAWAKKIPDEPKQDKAVQKFMRKKTQESCVEAVASTNTARLEAKAPRKKRAFVDSSEGEAGE